VTEEEKNIQKNKRIIKSFVISVVGILFSYVLIKSSPGEGPDFHYIGQQILHDPLFFLAGVVGFLLLWFCIVGGIPAASVFLLMLCFYFFLHRKDPKLLERNYHPKYEEEFHYGGKIALIYTYLATLILMLLNFFSIITYEF
jgi:hypothetical protein